MKTKMKRFISLLCVVTVLVSTALSTDSLSAKAETNSGQVETLPTDMTEISFRDFGIADKENYQGWEGKAYSGETMDNTLFSGTITFPQIAGAYITYAGNGPQVGLGLRVDQNANTGEWYLTLYHSNSALLGTLNNEKIYAGTAGVGKLVGVPLELHISMEYLDHDGRGQDNDLKLGIWFGDTLYKNQYIYIDDYVGANRTGNYLTYNSAKKSGGAMTLKSADIKLPTDMTEISFRDFGFEDGDYTQYPNGQYSGETLDNTLFGGKITFPESASAHLLYGGKVAGGGFGLVPAQNTDDGTWYLRLYDTKSGTSEKLFNEYKFYSDVAGVPLVGTKLKLHFSTEYVNNDNGETKNDLKLGVWFDGKLYDNKYIYIDNYVDHSHSIGTWMAFSINKELIVSIQSINIKLPTDMTEISFRDFELKKPGTSGVFTDKEYTSWNYGKYTGETLDNTLFSGTVTFPRKKDAALVYAGNEGQAGLSLIVSQNDATKEWYLRLGHSNTKFLTTKDITAETAGVTQLVGVPLELHISMEYVNLDGGTEDNDLKLGVWFGDTLYEDEYIYINDYVGAERTGHYLHCLPKNEAMTLKSADIKLPTDMTEISFRDFGFADGDYTQYPEGQYEGVTLDNTLFSGKITFPESDSAHLMYGGKVGTGGFDIVPAKDTTTGKWYLRLFDTNQDKSGRKFEEQKFYSDIAGVQLVGAELELNLSLEYVNNDGGATENDVKLGVWFGGKLYNNTYIYINNYVDTGHSMGTWMAFSIARTTKITIESVGKINWKPLPTGLTEITFRDFGFADGDYTQYPNGQYEGTTLDNTLFSGKITFPESADAHLMYGGKVAAGGFDIVPAQDATTGEWYLRLFDTNQDKSGSKFSERKFYSDVAGVTLVGKELELNLSIEYVNHDGGATKNDVKLGVWFGGKLYNNNYIYLDNYVDTGHSMGTWMAFSIAKTTKITIKSVGEINWKPLPTGMTEITFRDFGFTDGDYTQYPSGQYEGETLDNTLFSGKITFPESVSAHLMYGGKVEAGGFDIVPAQDVTTGEWYLRLFDTNQDKSGKKFSEHKFYSNVAGVPLVGEEVALMLSLQYVDKDGDGKKNDVQLGVWFAGKLYNNQYIYLNDFVNTRHSMGTWMAFSIAKTTKINIKSVGEIKWKSLPTGLTEIGFSDFGITSGVYEAGSKVGEYTGENLRNTLFSGIVKWHPEVGETHFIYGGTTSGGGFDLVNVTDEKTGEHYLRLFYTTPTEDGKKKYTNYYFHSDVAGVTLVGEELDLKISIEYVDNDGGKKDNDVRLGIWFGGKLYNNRYIYINNFGATGHILKNNIQIWNRNGASFSVGRISDWLDWSAFGLTANWKKTLLDTDFNLEYTLAGGNPYTGDDTTFSYLTMGVCLAVIVLCGCQLVRRRRNNYDI